jgi:phage major head subunit gpT-like protein
MLISTNTLLALRTNLRAEFQSAFETAKPWWAQAATEIPSSSRSNTYEWLGAFPIIREWLGDRVVQALGQSSYQILNKTFEGTVSVSRDDLEDDNLAGAKIQTQQLAAAAAKHPDQLLAALMVAAFTTGLAYDGQAFFSTTHPVKDVNGVAQNVSNSGGGAGNPWILAQLGGPIKPFLFQKRREYAFTALDDPRDHQVFFRKEFLYGVDARVNAGYGLWQLAYGSKSALSTANYDIARTALRNMTADGGTKLGVQPDTLIVGPSNEANALNIIAAANLANGASNIFLNTAKVLVVPELG